MKKKFLLATFLTFLTVGLVACDNDTSTGTGNLGEIVVITPMATHGWSAGVIYFAERAAADLGIEGNFRIVTSADIAEQSAQIDEVLAQDVGGIVFMPFNGAELQLAAERIVESGIPFVVFNRYVDVDYDAYVAGSNPMMGAESARIIGEGLDGEGTVVVVSNPSAGSSSYERVSAFQEVMAANFPNINLVSMTVPDFTRESSLTVAADVLTANPHIDAFFSIDDETSLGILQAIREANRTDVRFMSGGGGAQAYFREIYEAPEDITLFTATYSPRMIADAIEMVMQVMRGETVERQLIIPPTIITRDNVTNFFADDSPY